MPRLPRFPARRVVLALFALGTSVGTSVVGTSVAWAQNHAIRVVGSSTVFPFSASVAERFGEDTRFPTPIIEATGTGGGFKLFCSGIGFGKPDIVNASRTIKPSERRACAKNGVSMTEIIIGYDGIALANARGQPQRNLTLRELFLALAARVPNATGTLIANPNQRWRDINPSFPATTIEVLGPPPTSGTRDALVELAMEAGARTFPSLAALAQADQATFKAIAHAIREDGRWVDLGENDNLIVQKLAANPNALGVFGFSFLDQNRDRIQAGELEGAPATFDAIARGIYPLARPLLFYLKREHQALTPGLRAFALAFADDAAVGEDGYLIDKGLIPLPEDARAEVVARARTLAPLQPAPSPPPPLQP